VKFSTLPFFQEGILVEWVQLFTYEFAFPNLLLFSVRRTGLCQLAILCQGRFAACVLAHRSGALT